MRFRERSHEADQLRRQNPSPGDTAASNLAKLRLAGEEFLNAGEEAIRRALSGSSDVFLAATRQQGGE